MGEVTGSDAAYTDADSVVSETLIPLLETREMREVLKGRERGLGRRQKNADLADNLIRKG